MFGLRGMSSKYAEVQGIIQIMARKINERNDALSSQAIGTVYLLLWDQAIFTHIIIM